jgi:hypothetical protein
VEDVTGGTGDQVAVQSGDSAWLGKGVIKRI